MNSVPCGIKSNFHRVLFAESLDGLIAEGEGSGERGEEGGGAGVGRRGCGVGASSTSGSTSTITYSDCGWRPLSRNVTSSTVCAREDSQCV